MYKISQRVRIRRNSSIANFNEALKDFLGEVVTISSVSDEGLYTVLEIDGVEITAPHIEGVVDINLKNWHEETICPCCGSSDFSNSDDYQSNEIFRDFTCNSCNAKWVERYNLTKVTAYGMDLDIHSELEDGLLKENQIYKDFIKSLGYSDEQLAMIKDKAKVHLEAKCLSLKSDGMIFNPSNYIESDNLDALFLIGKDLVSVYVSQWNEVSISILSETSDPITLQFAENVKDFNVRKYIIDRYQEEKYPFLYDSEFDMDLLDEWSTTNMSFGTVISLFNDDEYVFIERSNGILKLESFKQSIDYYTSGTPTSSIIRPKTKYKLFWADPAFYKKQEHTSALCEVVNWPIESLVFKCFSKLAYEDYEHCQDEGKFGLEIGDFDYEGTCIESFENTWFETELARDEYIKRNGLYLDSSKIPEYVNDANYYTDLRNYSTDTIFYIKKVDGGEAEVTKNELWQLIEPKDIPPYFINMVIEGNTILYKNSPMIPGGEMSLHYDDVEILSKEELLLPLETLVKYYHLINNHIRDEFFFEGNDDTQEFNATIVKFRVDTDNSIIVVLEDQEEQWFDLSYDEIKGMIKH